MYNRIYQFFNKNNIYPLQYLLAKLENCGIRGMANNQFKSYLFDRKQFVSINGHVSNQTSVKYGVPQASVLGPLLFLIYILMI